MTLTCNVLPSQKFLRKSKGPCSQPPCSLCHAWWLTTGPFDCTYFSSIASKSIATMLCNIFNSRCRSKPDSMQQSFESRRNTGGAGRWSRSFGFLAAVTPLGVIRCFQVNTGYNCKYGQGFEGTGRVGTMLWYL